MITFEQFPETLTTRPTVCSWSINRLDAFWRTAGNQLGHRSYDGTWQVETIATSVTADPVACSWGPNRIDLFWDKGDGHLRQRTYASGWQPEVDLVVTQRPISRPGVCSWAANRLDLFWRNAANNLCHKWFDAGAWSGEEVFTLAAPFQMASAPTACSWGNGRIDVFWRGPSGSLIHQWYDGRWQGPEDLGGNFVDDPCAESWAPNVIDVFVRNPDNSIGHRWFDEGWHAWLNREGLTRTSPCVASWSDARLDLFVVGIDDHVWHGWWSGQPVATHRAEVKTVWQFLRDYGGSDKVQRLLTSIACGNLNGGCSGAMISPHIFLTASHCGGPGWTGGVSFYRINQFAEPADDRSQQLSQPYPARAFPWQDSGIGGNPQRGDTVLWWVPDGPDGIPPGIKYGYLELSELPVSVGARSYSFWQNPAIRLDTTLLYSEGVATAKLEDPNWLGKYTQFTTWTAGGASGSANLVAEAGHGHRVVGVTQGGPSSGGPSRNVPDAEQLVREYDSDRNAVIDAIDYDWLMTRVQQDFHYFLFTTPFELSRWMAVPGGSGTSLGSRTSSLSGWPRMTGTATKQDGFWNHFARFRPNRSHRITVVASGSASGGRPAYVKFRSDSTGHEVRFDFVPGSNAARFNGRVALGSATDYRLILGAAEGTTVTIEQLAVVCEGQPIGFNTHDERRAWEYAADARPTSWGARGSNSFAGAVLGPTTTPGWGLRNRQLALLPNTNYRIRFDVLPVRGPGGTQTCFAAVQELGGASVGQRRFDFVPGDIVRTHEFNVATGAGAKCLVFGADAANVYLVGDIQIDAI